MGATASYFSRIVRLAYLAPDITTAILDGRQPATLSATRLAEAWALPITWAAQRRALGFVEAPIAARTDTRWRPSPGDANAAGNVGFRDWRRRRPLKPA